MFKRIVSLLLCFAMVASFLPANAFPARAEEVQEEPTAWVHMEWAENGETKQWDNAQELSGLPSGVSYDPDSMTLTLNGAALTWLNFTDFYDRPVTLVVEGENTITGQATALNFQACSNVTVTGSGTLNLTADEYPFGWHDYNGEAASDYNLDGMLTFSGLTLNCTNTRTQVPEGYTDEDWSWFTPITLGGGNIRITDNAVLTCEGLGFIGVYGDLVVDGGAVVNGTGLHCNPWGNANEEAALISPSVTVAEGGTVNLYGGGRILATHNLLWLSPNSSLILDGGTLTIEEVREDFPYNIVNTGEATESCPGGEILVNSGELKIDAGKYVGNAIQIGPGCSYIQNGGTVTITADRDGTHGFSAVNLFRDGSFTLHGGSITVDNTAAELAPDSWVNAFHVERNSGEAVISGGTFTTSGYFSEDFALRGKLTVSGGEVNIRKIEVPAVGGNLTQVGGTVNSAQTAARWGGQFQLVGGSFNTGSLVLENGYARFLGGEASITQSVRVYYMNTDDALTYGSGINALYADTGEAISFADAEGEEAYSGKWTTPIGRAVSIKRQGVAADSFSGLMELMNGSYLSACTVGTVRLITSLPVSSADVTVTLPAGLMLAEGSVTVNGKSAPYTASGSGFTVNIYNGDIVRFGVIASAAGTYTVSAAACGNTVTLEVPAKAYTLAIPASVNEAVVPVSGTAAPGAQVTLYANDAQLLTVTANALGAWSAKLPLNVGEGKYDVFADITAQGATIRSDSYSVTYDDTAPVVETLTITNTIHGNTDADPNRDVSVVINFREGTRSQNYYTYWPELPHFRFAVKITNGTPDTVARVRVVATDYFGVEEAVYMDYDEASGLWTGTAEFCGHGDLVPEAFRVEWVPLVEITEPTEPEIPDPTVPEAHEENYTEDAIVVSDSLSYTFQLSDDAQGLTVTDDCGNEVTVTGGSFTGESGKRYCATLTAGTFREYGTNSLYILMPATGESSYTLADNVHLTEEAGYAVGDVVILHDEAWVITAVNGDGSYTYAEAALEDVFATLYMDGLTVSEGDEIIVEGDPEAAITQAFLESDFFADYTDTLEAYGEAEQLSGFKAPKVEVDFETKLEQGENNTTAATVKVEIFISSTAKAEMPGGEVETKVGYKLTYEIKRVFDLRIDKDEDAFRGASFYVDTTETQTHGIEVTVEGESSTEMTEELEEYFDEEWDTEANRVVHELLTELTDPDENEADAPICNLKIPTSIPFVFIEMGIDFVLKLEFSGSASLNLSYTTGDIIGLVITADRTFKPFYQKKTPEFKAFAEFHVEAKAGFALKSYFGARLLNLLTLRFNLELGPSIRAGGHGSSAISTNPAETKVQAEGWFGTAFDYAAGLEAKLKLVIATVTFDLPIFEGFFPLSFVGTDKMPYQFTSVEKKVQVYDKCDITQLVSHSMDFQRFSTGLKKESGVLDEENYTRHIENDRFYLDGTELRVRNPLQECEDWLVLTYSCENAGYQICKRVKLLYKPSSIVIHKSACCAPPEASFLIEEIPDGPLEEGETLFRTTAGTGSSGIVTVPVEPRKHYRVTETGAPAEHECVSPEDGYYEIYVGDSEVHVGFVNEKKERTPDNPLPSNGDPSGYVFEGIESNRLDGVTVTLYRSDAASGADALQWNAAEFDQENPLTTDAQGQYLWMVPSGWYQVRYSLTGYNAEQSEWMAVPPIRTGVNQAMTSYAPAEFTVYYSEVLDAVVVKFNRPVEPNFAEAAMTVNGAEAPAWLEPLDADWTVTEDPADSKVCATAFLLSSDVSLTGNEIVLTVSSVTYAGTESSGSFRYSVPEAHDHSYTAVVTEPTCTHGGYTTYTCSCGDTYRDDFVDALAHDWEDADCDSPKTCKRCRATEGDALGHTWENADCDTPRTCSVCGETEGVAQGHTWEAADCDTPKTCSVCGETEGDALGHDYSDGSCTRCGEEDPGYVPPSEPTEPEEPILTGVIRIAGADRIETSLMLAKQLQEVLNVSKFDAVVVASALNFPDALTGSYLAAEKKAPILLTYPDAHEKIVAYIEANLKSGGTVYILGGESAVDKDFENLATAKGMKVQRVAGSDRFGTNLEILKTAGNYAGKPLLIATATGFADSLSASATGLPMLLVYGKLTDAQKSFLATTSKKFIIIGGDAAVSAALEAELDAIGDVERVAGENRYQTSVKVADRFLEAPETAVLAYARNFPDGLCGGPVAYALGAPLILTDNYDPSEADTYVRGISAGIVVGGTGLISDAAARAIFDLAANTEITPQ